MKSGRRPGNVLAAGDLFYLTEQFIAKLRRRSAKIDTDRSSVGDHLPGTPAGNRANVDQNTPFRVAQSVQSDGFLSDLLDGARRMLIGVDRMRRPAGDVESESFRPCCAGCRGFRQGGRLP